MYSTVYYGITIGTLQVSEYTRYASGIIWVSKLVQNSSDFGFFWMVSHCHNPPASLSNFGSLHLHSGPQKNWSFDILYMIIFPQHLRTHLAENGGWRLQWHKDGIRIWARRKKNTQANAVNSNMFRTSSLASLAF